jgi:acetyltransferase-like isoleucine patch superfamily enzyme
VEACSWIGIGSRIIDNVNIGDGSFIGAGSVVVKDISESVLAYENPAHVI